MNKITLLVSIILVWGVGACSQSPADSPTDSPTDSEAVPTEISDDSVFNQLPQRRAEGYGDITWADLTDVSYEPKFYPEIQESLLFPSFGENVRGLEDKSVTIAGYVIPTNPDSNYYVLSANPMQSCFFCGGAGPESMVQLNLAGKGDYEEDEWRAFKGVLRLNDSDIDQLNYILDRAVEVPAE